MYCVKNFQTKRKVKEALVSGLPVRVFQPGPFATDEPISGTVYLEGPHYPRPHRWWALGVAVDGILISIK
jgi:hypothetical protein